MFRSLNRFSPERPQSVPLAALALALLLFAPAAAIALPLDVFFQGIRPAGEPETAFGIGEAAAINARDNFGIEWVTGAVGSTIVDTLEITQSDPTGFSSTPGADPFNRASSNWDLENVSGAALTGASYLVLTHTDPFDLDIPAPGSGTVAIDYMDENVGFTIDADDGWSIIIAESGGQTFYYPALLLDTSVPNPLDGNLAPGASVLAEINYAVNAPLIEVGTGTNVFALPEFQVRFAQVVPEPGTATLFALGLIGLASVTRKD